MIGDYFFSVLFQHEQLTTLVVTNTLPVDYRRTHAGGTSSAQSAFCQGASHSPVGLRMVWIHRRKRQEWLGLSSAMGLLKMFFKASNSGQIFVGTQSNFFKNRVQSQFGLN